MRRIISQDGINRGENLGLSPAKTETFSDVLAVIRGLAAERPPQAARRLLKDHQRSPAIAVGGVGTLPAAQ
jgi:hypothetical protein